MAISIIKGQKTTRNLSNQFKLFMPNSFQAKNESFCYFYF